MGTKTGVFAPITLINLTYYYSANLKEELITTIEWYDNLFLSQNKRLQE